MPETPTRDNSLHLTYHLLWRCITTNEDAVKRCVEAGVDAYLEATKAGMNEESAFLFGKLAFEGMFQLEVQATNLLLNLGAKRA